MDIVFPIAKDAGFCALLAASSSAYIPAANVPEPCDRGEAPLEPRGDFVKFYISFGEAILADSSCEPTELIPLNPRPYFLRKLFLRRKKF